MDHDFPFLALHDVTGDTHVVIATGSIRMPHTQKSASSKEHWRGSLKPTPCFVDGRQCWPEPR